MSEKIKDPTGVELTPGAGEDCAGYAECCDECDYFLECFPEYEKPYRRQWQTVRVSKNNSIVRRSAGVYNQGENEP